MPKKLASKGTMTPSDRLAFEFVADDQIRPHLVSDAVELSACLEGGAWKACIVLSGSIIEALLIDYLRNVGFSERATKDPLRMTLEDLIKACRDEGGLNDDAEHLAHAVRGYRNLIHPGRAIRQDDLPSRETAVIAESLVRVISQQLSQRPNKNVGQTAIQVLAKIKRDPASVRMFDHVLKDVRPAQRTKLLLELIPRAWMDAFEDGDFRSDDVDEAIKGALKFLFRDASEEIKQQYNSKVAALIRDGSASTIREFINNLYRGYFILYADQASREIIARRAATEIETSGGYHSDFCEGILFCLPPADAIPAAERFLRAASSISSQSRERLVQHLGHRGLPQSRENAEEVAHALDAEKTRQSLRRREHVASWLQEIIDEEIPF
jgi:hypothetical protein